MFISAIVLGEELKALQIQSINDMFKCLVEYFENNSQFLNI